MSRIAPVAAPAPSTLTVGSVGTTDASLPTWTQEARPVITVLANLLEEAKDASSLKAEKEAGRLLSLERGLQASARGLLAARATARPVAAARLEAEAARAAALKSDGFTPAGLEKAEKALATAVEAETKALAVVKTAEKAWQAAPLAHVTEEDMAPLREMLVACRERDDEGIDMTLVKLGYTPQPKGGRQQAAAK